MLSFCFSHRIHKPKLIQHMKEDDDGLLPLMVFTCQNNPAVQKKEFYQDANISVAIEINSVIS